MNDLRYQRNLYLSEKYI